MSKQTKFSLQVREGAVCQAREQRSEHSSLWAAVESIVPMIGCTSQTLLGGASKIKSRTASAMV
ncbi:transposase IS3/IS911 [Burkholderia aenigmatica]|uniref:Transposase IS3/IS911 n=1 Tax=Burkholderia aenigmatica TaxID=2015348 RepID=A0ABY6Y368_9BURK|nr:transposase IS3/IS911 [Burkholderia aenigmatica]